MNSLLKAQIYLFFLIIILASCQRSDRLDLSHIDVDIKIVRFDQEMGALTAENAAAKNQEWKQHYDPFYSDFTQYMLEIGHPDEPQTIQQWQQVVQSADFEALKTAIQSVFPDLAEQETALTEAFKHIRYYFPESEIPKFYSFFSGFSIQIPVGENYMGIGLDMFLGADSKFYPALRESIPTYISRRFTPENVIPRVVESYIREELYPLEQAELNLLQQMVYGGSVLYAMERVMPDVADSLIIGYTATQLNWAERYEKDIWSWFLEEKLLYEYDYHRIQKYVSEAPFTPELGDHHESAPKLGLFLGWRIVRKYMERHPEVSLRELMETADAQGILEASRYKGA